MKIREVPRTVPNKAHYFRVDLHAELDQEITRRRAVVDELRLKAASVPEDQREAATAAAERRVATLEQGIARMVDRRQAIPAAAAVHVFRVPSYAEVAVLSQLAVTSQFDAKAQIADGQVPVAVFGSLAAMVAGCWFHPLYDLETKRGDDLEAWGAAVYEELYEAEYSAIEVRILGKACATRIGAAVITEAEVRERVGFSNPTPGAAT